MIKVSVVGAKGRMGSHVSTPSMPPPTPNSRSRSTQVTT